MSDREARPKGYTENKCPATLEAVAERGEDCLLCGCPALAHDSELVSGRINTSGGEEARAALDALKPEKPPWLGGPVKGAKADPQCPDGSEVTAKFEFVVEVTPDELDGGFVVKCLNLPGCVSEGETVDEALDNLADAIAGVMITRFEERDREIERLKQGLWDCAGAAGTDLDGDPTPRHLAYPDIVDFALRAVRELRRDYDEGLVEGRQEPPAVTTSAGVTPAEVEDENLD